MTSTEDLPPGIEEQYLSANHTSNLRVVAEKKGAGDLLIAAAWSPTRIGAALIRLHGEFDGAEKRPRMSETDLLLLRAQLKSLPTVLVQVVLQMTAWSMADPEGRAGPLVGHWLYPGCVPCDRLGFEKIRGTPALSAVRCKVCHGAKERPVPYGMDGRRMLNWMDECVGSARASIQKRLRNTR